MHNYKELIIWQKAIDLVTDIYKVTVEFPDFEKYGLSCQIQRSAVSIPSNIAEGSGRRSEKDFLRFLDVSKGSAFELETQLIIALKLNYLSKEEAEEIFSRISELQKMIYGFCKKLKNNLDS